MRPLLLAAGVNLNRLARGVVHEPTLVRCDPLAAHRADSFRHDRLQTSELCAKVRVVAQRWRRASLIMSQIQLQLDEVRGKVKLLTGNLN